MSFKLTSLSAAGVRMFSLLSLSYITNARDASLQINQKKETIGWKHLNIISWSLVDTLKLESSHAWKTKLDSYQILVILSNQNSARRATHSLVVVKIQLICSSVEWKVPAKSRFYFLDKQFHVCKCHKFDIGVKKLVSYLNHKILRKRIKWIVLQLHHSRLHFLDKQFHL